MSEKKRRFVTAQEIDGMTAIKSPHAHELESLGKAKVDIFLKNKKRRIKILVENNLNGRVENLGFGEDYTVTFEFFPEVMIHLLFYNYEDEEDLAMGEAEIKVLFSGERVMWVPTEDSVSLLESTLEYLENLLSINPEIYGLSGEKSELLKTAITQREEPFKYLKSEHLNDLAIFVGGNITQNSMSWTLSKTYFKGITVSAIYNLKNHQLDLGYEGENLIRFNNYARDQLGIFLLNHCLRFIAVTYPTIKMPNIVKQTFSYSYIKKYL